MTRSALFSGLLILAIGVGATPSHAQDCVDFKWDVAQERALFGGSATALTAGADAKSAPSMQVGRLYELRLLSQEQLTFSVTPGAKKLRSGSFAGLVAFKIPATGSYRVSIDAPFWIDIVHDGALVAAFDYQAQRGCSAPHKIVVFDLPGNRPFLLQLSNAESQTVKLTITAAPLRKI